jgi:lipopolysaccharide biosynthesis regulator YciM
MAKMRPRRRRLPQEPEEVLTLAQRLIAPLQPYLKWVGAAAVVLAVVLAAWAIHARLKEGRQERAAAALALVTPNLAKPEKDAETLKELEKLIQEHQGTPAAQEAELLRANLLYRLNRYADAASAYRSLLGRDPALDPFIQESLSYCYEGLGEFRQAADLLQPLAEKATGDYRGELLINRARLLERAGDRPAASQVWRQVLEQPLSPALEPYVREKAGAAGVSLPVPALQPAVLPRPGKPK